MKNVLIVESPAKSKTIGKYLGADYEVVASMGHIRDLATTGKEGLGVDVDNDFTPNYITNPDKKKVVKELKKAVVDADNVYLASDPDREGEAIAWALAEELDLPLSDKNRVVFNEITKAAIVKAVADPRTIDMDLVHSQETRRIFDRIIGFKLSKLLKKKIKSRSAGRVQSVALKMIVEREREIEKFIPQEYWTIDAKFGGKPPFTATLTKINDKKAEIKDESSAQAIVDDIDEFNVSAIKESIKKRAAKPPFITSTLQQDASNKLGFSAKKTMSLAQKLYEGIELNEGSVGLITYMRTDSYRLSDQFLFEAKDFIAKEFGADYTGFYATKQNKRAQDAHEAIRPTYCNYKPDDIKNYLSKDEYKLYDLIYCRAISALMAPARFNSLTINLTCKKYLFTANGSTLIFDGYLKLYDKYESAKDELLPVLKEGQILKAKDILPLQHFTEPPLRYSEARLIKEMEEKGIGRPSTYAVIIDKITDRYYAELKKSSEGSKTKVFFPTTQGYLTSDKLAEFFSGIINIDYTSNLESELDEIAEGNLEYVKVLRTFYDELEPLVKKAYEEMDTVAPEEVGRDCPDCGKPLVYRQGRFGKFIACSGYPTCKYHESLTQKEEPKYIDRTCPLCGAPLVERVSRRYKKKFIGCSAYPKCNYLENINKGKDKEVE